MSSTETVPQKVEATAKQVETAADNKLEDLVDKDGASSKRGCA